MCYPPVFAVYWDSDGIKSLSTAMGWADGYSHVNERSNAEAKKMISDDTIVLGKQFTG